MTDTTSEEERAVGFSLEEEEHILEQRYKKARRGSTASRRAHMDAPTLGMTSLMDMITIILVFLLMNIKEQRIEPEMSDELYMPWSTSQLPLEDTITITITTQAVLVNNNHAVDVRDGDIDAGLRLSATSPIIPQLQTAVEDVLHVEERWDVVRQQAGERVATIVADHNTTYQVLTYVMMTASAAGIQNFKFAILNRSREALFNVGS
jgi:biopolymer transport protein ExbD